jgi:hypothetical protein
MCITGINMIWLIKYLTKDRARTINFLKTDATYLDVHIEAIFESVRNNLNFYSKAFEYIGQNSLIEHIKNTAYQSHAEIIIPRIKNEIPMQNISYSLNYHANCVTFALVEWVKEGAVIAPCDVVSIVIECMPSLIKSHYVFKKYQ